MTQICIITTDGTELLFELTVPVSRSEQITRLGFSVFQVLCTDKELSAIKQMGCVVDHYTVTEIQ